MKTFVWWKNGRPQGAFSWETDPAGLLDKDGFVLVVPRNRLIRRIDGRLEEIDLSRSDHHLSPSEMTVLIDVFLKHSRGIRGSWREVLGLLGCEHPRPSARTTVDRWMMHIRAVVQDGKPDLFVRTDKHYGGVGARYAWYLNESATYMLIDRDYEGLSGPVPMTVHPSAGAR
jgi:hypothetical protein